MAEKNSYRAIGLMSGTSLDGLDMAYCQFDKTNEGWQFELLQSQSIAYEDAFRQRLADTVHLNGEDLLLLHQSYGRWLGEQVSTFVNAHQLMPDLVA
ncbi:MAG: anhydro-N-acetylmuramic acid kinase, partial [Bacteroidota bacterium]